MVKLTLIASKGNAARAFPHTGFLALSPIKLEGIVRTVLDDDRKPLPANDLFVALRCYEARIDRTGHAHTNLLVDHRVLLWSKPPHQQWADVGDGEWPFRIVLPPALAGNSSAHFQEYRVFWRIEAVLNHIPIAGVGYRQIKTFTLALTRYDPGEPLPLPDPKWSLARSSKFRAHLRYFITAPILPVGPMDLVPVSVKLTISDSSLRVHAIHVTLQRRLQFNEFNYSDSTTSSTTALVEPAPSPSAPSHNAEIASATVSGIPRDENGLHAKTVTLQIPTQKSSSHWAIGETMRTTLVTLRFFLRVTVTLAHTPTSSLDTLDLAEREIRLVATNDSQRRLAFDTLKRSRAPSPLPTPPMTPNSLHNQASPKTRPKTPRRPHTSAGPRDTPRATSRKAAPVTFRDLRDAAGEVSVWTHDEEARSRWQTVAIVGGGTPVRSAFVPAAADSVQAWEEELERIAAQSRRRSVEMLRFSERRTRPRIDTASSDT